MSALAFFSSPLGWLRVEAGAQGLRLVRFAGVPSDEERGAGWRFVEEFFDFAEAYFAGSQNPYPGRLDLSAASSRQRRLWLQTMQIPYGRTLSYAALGKLLDMHPRSVGAGMRAAPLLLVIPAQRVIYADGGIGGFAGREGAKAWLLQFEKRNLRV